MRFHLSMMLMVFAVAMGMHALATAAQPLIGNDPLRAARYDAALREAGEHLNGQLGACRDHASQQPKASKLDLKVCERAARREFRREVKLARVTRAPVASTH